MTKFYKYFFYYLFRMSESNYDEIKIKVEAILFSYGDWIGITELSNILGLDSKMLVENALQELQKKYESDYPFVVEVGENTKWRMALKSEFEEIVSEVVHNVEIPKNVLKVLSVIAYEQPVTKTRLSEILGKSVKQEVGWLYRSKFLSYEKRGIGKYYRVTKKFFDYFKLDETEDFRQKANKNITEFLEEPIPDEEKTLKKESSEIVDEVQSSSEIKE